MSRQVAYTYEDLLRAYLSWVQKYTQKRDDEWNTYCDIRDNLPLGTTESRTSRVPTNQEERDRLKALKLIERLGRE